MLNQMLGPSEKVLTNCGVFSIARSISPPFVYKQLLRKRGQERT